MNLNLGIHDVTSVTTQTRCLNGQWQVKLEVRCADGSEATFVLFTERRLPIIDLPDEHVRLADRGPAKIEYSATPFVESPSASPKE
jgi:hypothetical protein